MAYLFGCYETQAVKLAQVPLGSINCDFLASEKHDVDQ